MRFCNMQCLLFYIYVFQFDEIHVILIVDIGKCKLVWMLLLPDHPISPCCYWCSRGPCWGDNRVEPYFVPFLFPLLFRSHVCIYNLNWTFLTRFAETGEALVSSVDKVIFVGSPGVGKMVWILWQIKLVHHILSSLNCIP